MRTATPPTRPLAVLTGTGHVRLDDARLAALGADRLDDALALEHPGVGERGPVGGIQA